MADTGFKSGSISLQRLRSFQYRQAIHKETFEISLLQNIVNVEGEIQKKNALKFHLPYSLPCGLCG